MSTDGRFRRLLLALPHFSGAGEASLTDVAERLGIARDVLLEDLHALAERYDEPAAFTSSLGVLIDGDAVTVRAGRFRRPMRLSASELCALELGLLVLARELPSAGAGTITGLRRRVEALIADLPRDRDVGGRRDGALGDGRHAEVLDALRTALRTARVVRMTYSSAREDAPRERLVHPHQLTFARGSWYVTGWCETAETARVFRVDRVGAVLLTEQAAREAPGELAEQVLADGTPFIGGADVPTFTVRYSPAIARWIAERDGLGLEGDGSARRTLPLADRDWAVRHVLQYGPDATVESPRELWDDVCERLRRMLR